jgi:hypothetical protein
MKSSVTRTLRLTSVLLLALGLGIWAASGARLGWTQTSVVSMQRDEITGIDFPVRRNAFRAGIEIPVLAAIVAAAAAGASVLVQRRSVRIEN